MTPALPSRKELIDLVRLAQAGDDAARQMVLAGVYRMCCKTAIKIHERLPERTRRSIDADDLANEGVFGADTAIDRFEESRGCAFTTYATFWIRNAMLTYVSRQRNTIRLPVMWYSNDEHASERDRLTCMSWTVPETFIDGAEDRPYGEDELQQLRDAIRRLPARTRKILMDRLEGRTLKAIGEECSMCRERIRQVEADGLRALAKRLGATDETVSMARAG